MKYTNGPRFESMGFGAYAPGEGFDQSALLHSLIKTLSSGSYPSLRNTNALIKLDRCEDFPEFLFYLKFCVL